MAELQSPQAFSSTASSDGTTASGEPPLEYQDEGVCFTAGIQGAPFGAGVIHAYLAAGRKPPRVVTGISMGSLTAAAFQRAFRESLKNPAQEDMRWQWYRRYLKAISENPLEVIWSGIPDQSDFFAEFIPVKDPVPETITDPDLRRSFTQAELEARRDLTLFVKLGHWVSRLPVKVHDVAEAVISYVRVKEGYGYREPRRSFSWWWACFKILLLAVVHNVVHPQWVKEADFLDETQAIQRRKGGAIAFVAMTLLILEALVLLGPALAASPTHKVWLFLQLAVLAIGAVLIAFFAKSNPRPLFGWPVYCLCWSVCLAIVLPLLALLAKTLIFGGKHIHSFFSEVLGVSISVNGAGLQAAGKSLLLALRRGMLFLFVVLMVAALYFLIQLFKGNIRNEPAELKTVAQPVTNLASSARWRRLLKPLASLRVWIWIISTFVVVAVVVIGIVLLWSPFAHSVSAFFSHGAPDTLLSALLRFVNWLRAGIVVASDHWPTVISLVSLVLLIYMSQVGRPLSAIFENLNLHKSLVNNYYLRFVLFDLFQENGKAPRLSSQPFPAVLVAAPLQVIKSSTDDLGSYQVWPKPGANLIDVLSATLAVPGLYEPARLERTVAQKSSKHGQAEATQENRGLEGWEIPEYIKAKTRVLDLVDGTVIRQNPLPALFNFIAQNKELARQLSSTDDKKPAKLHVVYSVPIDPIPPPPEARDCNVSIVDVGLAAMKLSRRRDTQLEVHQTNLLSKVEHQLRLIGSDSSGRSPIFVDEIAPTSDKDFKNPMSPTRDEVLTRVAAGCRATLETLYADKLVALRGNEHEECIRCERLIRIEIAQSNSWRPLPQGDLPGLSEVCQACTQKLKAPLRQDNAENRGSNTWSSLLADTDGYMHEQLISGDPRIVFVASGGVFRGSFHAGMLAALLAAHIKPDLIVGASVGTIMGGVLASAFSTATYASALVHLQELTKILLSVDQEIAFTKPFKNAVRDIAIRARGIAISPNELRRIVLKGSKHDPSFAAVGAPSALIDSLSHLLLIPHRRTGLIAAEFVAGHVTGATKKLLQQLRRETLKRLNIEYAVIGTSLLEPAVRRLLVGGDGKTPANPMQPFDSPNRIALYGTTIDYWLQRPVLLGATRPDRGPSYDLVEAVLSSSAFPCVFSTRRESDLYPGTGSPTTLFCDGGMFDNLPFLPATEILAKAQSTHIRYQRGLLPWQLQQEISIRELERRCKSPDLFIAGSLDVNLQAQDSIDNRLDDIFQIWKRASALQNNVKIKSFEQVLLGLDKQLQLLVDQSRKQPHIKLDFDFIDQIVNAAVLPVYPSDSEHLNGTFAFCASTGLKQERLRNSISNGCFQTFRAFVNPCGSSGIHMTVPEQSPLARSLSELQACNKLPTITWNDSQNDRPGICKYFQVSADPQKWPKIDPHDVPAPFTCPFFQVAASAKLAASAMPKNKEREFLQRQAERIERIYQGCLNDTVHYDIYNKSKSVPREPVQEPPVAQAVAAAISQ